MDTEPALEISGSMATLALCRPAKANRISRSDLDVLKAHIDQVNRTSEVRVLRLVASGKNFCSGYDLISLEAAAGEVAPLV